MKRIYLDYAAATPVDPTVVRAMRPYFSVKFGNPGSLHSFGQDAIAAVDRARESIARSIGAGFRDIVFTGSATEANNLALRGSMHGIVSDDRVQRGGGQPRIIVSAIEHESILESARALEHEGVEIIITPVNRNGIVDVDEIKKSLNERTVLVSVMYANNEIGSIQPIQEIAAAVREFRGMNRYPLFHTDAAQAFQFLACTIQNVDVDLMTISAHKIYGPKGVGALYIKDGDAARKNSAPLIAGGGQEFGLRSGTENVPAIVGFAKAVESADAVRRKESKRVAGLRQELWRGIKKIYPKADINGGGESLPNILNVYFPDHDAQDLLTAFDLAGVAVSSGSACRSRAMESSYIIEALGYTKKRAASSIRFSLGRPTTGQEIRTAVKLFSKMFRTH